MKKIILLLLFCVMVSLFIPIIITYSSSGMADTGLFDEIKKEHKLKLENEKIKISLKDGKTGTLTQMNLDEYITLVISSEIPLTYHDEMIKAVAVCVRTYAYKRLIERDSDDVIISLPYVSKVTLKEKWGDSFDTYYNRIKNLTESTGTQIITYENEPIEAIFHAVSCGSTEDYKNVWQENIPYLIGVPSTQDEGAPNYYNVVTVTKEEFIKTLENAIPDILVAADNILSQLQIVERTKNGYVVSMQIGNKIIDAQQFVKLYKLSSSSFTIDEEEEIKIISKGIGHGVGLSLYGANVLANNGYSWDEIINIYYTNVKIKDL